MNDRKKYWIICLIALAFIGALPPSTQAKTFKEWFCSLLGIDPKVYDKLTRSRGPSESPVAGLRLMKRNLKIGTEEILWDCNGCWSPVMLNSSEIAVLKKDPGTEENQIWIVPVTKPANRRQVFKGSGIDVLLGRASKSNRLLLAQKIADCRQSSDGEYSIREIDLSARDPKLQKPSELPQPCISAVDASPKPDQIRNQILLGTSDNKDINSGQPIRRELTKLLLNDGYSAPLVSQPDEHFESYDPIWLSDDAIIYIKNPWPSL